MPKTPSHKPKTKRGAHLKAISAEMEMVNENPGTAYADQFRRAIGRPRSWENVDEFASELAAFFMECDLLKKRPSKAGMYAYMATTRDTIRGYEGRPDFFEAIKSAYAIIESAWVDRLNESQATGAIFLLKNAFQNEYKDRTEVKGEVLHRHAVVMLPPKRVLTDNEVVIVEDGTKEIDD